MSHRLDLSSSRAKLGRAEHHLKELEGDITSWANGGPDGVPALGRRYELKTHPDRLELFSTHVKPIKREWSLLIGDVLTNFGAALDHLAWELVPSKRQLNEKQLRAIYFPLYATTRKDFLANVRRRELPGVSKHRLLMLSPFQPYKSRQQSWFFRNRLYLNLPIPPGPLMVLKTLLRVDKHRTVLVTILRPGSYRTSPGVVESTVPMGTPREPLKANAHLVTFILRSPLPADVSYDEVAMHAQFTPTVGFQDVGTAVIPTLQDMATEIKKILWKLGG